MSIIGRKTTLSILAAGVWLGTPTGVVAGGQVTLTERQLDSVTAAQGGPAAESAAAAAASGLTTVGNSSTVAVTGVGNSPFNGSTGQATGVAFGLGANGVIPGTSSATASTFAEAPGNVVVNLNYTQTIYGIGSTLQVSVSASTGLFVPGLP